jgi:hypothetical protein
VDLFEPSSPLGPSTSGQPSHAPFNPNYDFSLYLASLPVALFDLHLELAANVCVKEMSMSYSSPSGVIAPDPNDFAYYLMEGSMAHCIDGETTGDFCDPRCPEGSTMTGNGESFRLQCTQSGAFTPGTGEIKDPNKEFTSSTHGDLAGPKAHDGAGALTQTVCVGTCHILTPLYLTRFWRCAI